MTDIDRVARAIRDEYRAIWPGSRPALPEAKRLAQAALNAITSPERGRGMTPEEIDEAVSLTARMAYAEGLSEGAKAVAGTDLHKELDTLRAALRKIGNPACLPHEAWQIARAVLQKDEGE